MTRDLSGTHDSKVCGQDRRLVAYLRTVMLADGPAKLAAVEVIREDLRTQLASISEDVSVGVSLGYPMRSDAEACGEGDAVFVAFIMDPLDVDCKQRTHVSLATPPAVRSSIEKVLYKYCPAHLASETPAAPTS